MKRWIIWGVGLGVSAAVAWGGYQYFSNHQAVRQPDQQVRPVYRDLTVRINGVGVVSPQNRVEIKAPIAGRMERMLVSEGQWVHQGQTMAWMSSSERAALLDVARSKGPAELRRWETMYRPAPLVAPVNGQIISRLIEPGQTVTQADVILVISDRLIVRVQADETDIGRIRLGQPAEMELDAYPGQPFGGTVNHIAYEAKTVNNVTIYDVEVEPESAPAVIRSGMSVNVGFIVDSVQNVLVIPTEAIHDRNGKQQVRVQIPGDAKPQYRTIQTGISDGKYTQVLAGLTPEDTVLMSGFKGRERGAVKTNPFAPNRPASSGGGRSRG